MNSLNGLSTSTATTDRPNLPALNLDFLKLLAIVSMTIDHACWLFIGNISSFGSYIGRLAYPAFLFILIVNYLFHSRNRLRYVLRLVITASISQPIFTLCFQRPDLLNILFSFSLALMIVEIYRRSLAPHSDFLIGLITLTFLGSIHRLSNMPISFEYGWPGLVLALSIAAYLRTNLMLYPLIGLIAIFFMTLDPGLWLITICYAAISILLAHLVTVKLTSLRNFKLWLYLFYPLHLLILLALKTMLIS